MAAVQGTSMMEALGKDGLLRPCHSDEGSSHVSDEVGLMGAFMSFVLPQCPATQRASLSDVSKDTPSLAGNGENISMMENASSIVSIKLARDMEGLSVLIKEGLIFQEDIDVVQHLFQPSSPSHDSTSWESGELPNGKGKTSILPEVSVQAREGEQTKGRWPRDPAPFLEMAQELHQFAPVSVVTRSDHAHHLASIHRDRLSNERIIFNTASNSENEVAPPLVLETQAQERLSMKLVEVEKSEKNLVLLSADRQISDQGDGSFAQENAMQYGFEGSDQASHFSEENPSGVDGFFLGKLDAFQQNFEGAVMEKIVVTERAAMGLTTAHLRVLEAIREAGVAESRRISIALRPESLGSVEISVEMSALGQLSIFIQAEKPTTYDLLRQDASVLQQALMESGFDVQGENLHFSFGDSQNMNQEFIDSPLFQQSENEEAFHQDSEKIEERSIPNPNYVHMKA